MDEIKKFNASQFWKRADSLMKARNISITTLSEELGHSKSYISSSKTSKNFKVSILLELAQVLGCSSDWLLGLSDTFRPVEYESRNDIDRLLALMIKALTPEQKKRLIDEAAAMSGECNTIAELYKEDIEEATKKAISKSISTELVEKEIKDIRESIAAINKSVDRLQQLSM